MSDSKISEQMIEVPGGVLYTKRWTPEVVRNQVPLILMHDSLGCVQMWKEFPRRLSESLGRVVIAYDRLGYGRSSSKKELPSVRFVNEEVEIYLPVIFKTLQIKKFAVFGHSVGGAMAVEAAVCFTEDCQAVITESAQAFVEDLTRNGIIKAKTDFLNVENFSKLEKYHKEKTRWVLDAWIDVWLSDEFAAWSLKDSLPKMRCPVLVIHGDRDEYGSEQFPELICKLAGGSSLKCIISDCGHSPHREKEELVIGLVANWPPMLSS